MHIEQISLRNFRAFREVDMRNIPRFAIIIGANGSGKSTLFTVFGFLREAMATNVNAALGKLGGSQGFSEVRSRNSDGPIEIELKFREENHSPLVTYTLSIDQDPSTRRAYVAKEILQYRRGSKGKPWRFLNFARGEGEAVTNEIAEVSDESQLQRDHQKLKSDDILAIKGLAQFEKFPAAVALGNLIERWHISDFHISRARPEQEAGYAEHLSREGENLALVIEYLHNSHPVTFNKIITKLTERVPGITKVKSKQTQEGRILLKFQDGSFEDPFLARYVSDGTITRNPRALRIDVVCSSLRKPTQAQSPWQQQFLQIVWQFKYGQFKYGDFPGFGWMVFVHPDRMGLERRSCEIASRAAAATAYCKPYSSWEKGGVENYNGLVRQYFPKGSDFTEISEERLQEVEDEINNRPRNVLNYETPNDQIDQLKAS